MINVAVCDDDTAELSNIMSLIGEYRTIYNKDIVCTSFSNPLDLIGVIGQGKQFDIIFLDIIMPLFNGMEAAKEIRAFDSSIKIIFITSSSEFAVESYAVGAFYYALKPLHKDKLFEVLNRVIDELEIQDNDSLIIKGKDGISRILLSKLEYCEVIGKNLFYYLSSGKVLESTGTISGISDSLIKHPHFIKPHRSYIVNMEYIDHINRKEISMQNLARIPMARGNYNAIKEAYLEFFFESR